MLTLRHKTNKFKKVLETTQSSTFLHQPKILSHPNSQYNKFLGEPIIVNSERMVSFDSDGEKLGSSE